MTQDVLSSNKNLQNSNISYENRNISLEDIRSYTVFDGGSTLANTDDATQKMESDKAVPSETKGLVTSSRYNNTEDNASNLGVQLRHPNAGRQVSRESNKNGTSSFRHSNSLSEMIKIKNQSEKLQRKDQKCMVLPLPSSNRPRNLNLSSVNNQSSDALCSMGQPYTYSFANRATPSTPLSPFSPGILSNGETFPINFVYSNHTTQNGEYSFSPGNFGDNFNRESSTPVTSSSSNGKISTSSKDQKISFTNSLTTSLSVIYAILLVTLGVAFYIIDSQVANETLLYIAEGLSLTILGIALLYLLYLIIDIRVYNHKKRKFEKFMETVQPEQMEVRAIDAGVSCDVTLHTALSLRKQLDHRYCFTKDRHSSNFYLKIGAAVFCFGHLIHSFLILAYRGVILSSEQNVTTECVDVATFLIEILYPIYSVIQLFFIFKYSNVIINKNRGFHRFGFMHCLSSSLCFWLWTIFKETSEYINNSKYKSHNNVSETADDDSVAEKKNRVFQMLTPFRFTANCENDEMNIVYRNYSPYLYPFSVEYSILVVGIIYIVWRNIGLCALDDLEFDDVDHLDEDARECKKLRRCSEPESNITIHVDCHASNKGLFGGFIVLVFVLVSIILFFITFYQQTDYSSSGLVVIRVTNIIIICLMLFAVIFAYSQLVKLDANESAHNTLDNFLCLMCLPAFFVHGIFSIIPGIINGKVSPVVDIIMEIIQVVVQTTFIIEGMSRSSNTKRLRKSKPGREFVTFLIICNISMWIMQTFEVKSHNLDQYREKFYSKEMWSIIGHSCLPLMMFYRFHSSVCIGDIWKYAYMPSGH